MVLAQSELVPEPIRNPLKDLPCGWGIGVAERSDGGGIIELAVADEKAMMRKLRTMAPVLSGVGAKLVTVTHEGICTYECGFTFPKING